MQTLGFLGAGNMAGAIIQGLLNNGFDASKLTICDMNADKLVSFAQQGCNITPNASDLFNCEAVLLAVKPQVLKDIISPLAETAQQHKPLILSVVAAIDARSIEHWLGGDLAVIRTMPNTPALVMAGATGLYANTNASTKHKQFAESIFESIGQYAWVDDEALLHSVTAAAGSAPAYFFRFAEAMIKTATLQGLTKAQARTLIGQTMLGAAKMINETQTSVDQMRINVCSPNGTTERAINSFDADNIDQVVENAMKACFDRSIELSELLGEASLKEK
jgi:pyrroline-5-carboxylate reductase